MLILHRDYKFTHADVGKKVLLSNSLTCKILTIIVEAGQLHSIYGVLPGFTDVIEWDAHGKSTNVENDIILLFEDADDNGHQRERN